MNTFGYNQANWTTAKEEARSLLLARAARRHGQTISYSELAGAINSISFNADDRSFHALLGELSEEELAANRGMLSVLVVHKNGDLMPGPGFFELASRLGHEVRDREAFWIKEMKRVLDAHKK